LRLTMGPAWPRMLSAGGKGGRRHASVECECKCVDVSECACMHAKVGPLEVGAAGANAVGPATGKASLKQASTDAGGMAAAARGKGAAAAPRARPAAGAAH
jgi:hypothetical protein